MTCSVWPKISQNCHYYRSGEKWLDRKKIWKLLGGSNGQTVGVAFDEVTVLARPAVLLYSRPHTHTHTHTHTAAPTHGSHSTPSPQQWRRSVVKKWVRASQVKPSNCFRLHHTSMISKHWSRYRENYLRKFRLIFTDNTKTCLNLQSYPTNSFEWKTETLLYIFMGSRTPNPPESTSMVHV